jgi:tetratricopeptide (TPR) repeat protein
MVTTMNARLYGRIVQHILGDVAERRTDSGEYLARGRRRSIPINGQRRRVFVHGDHVCYQNEQFHDSDSEYRLALAVAAAEIIEQERLGGSWGSNTKACLLVAETLLHSGCERLKRRFLNSDQCTQDGDVCPPRKSSESPFLRLAGTIRRQVQRYRTRHSDWRRDFDFQIAMFRASRFRDAEWYREAEEGYEQWLSDFEKRQEFVWFEAMKIIGLARLYHEQHKIEQAVAVYRKAIRIARKAIMPEEFRQFVLAWLRTLVKACLRKARSLPRPVYLGPHTNICGSGGEITRHP